MRLPPLQSGYPVPESNPPGVGSAVGDTDPLVRHLMRADPGESVRVGRDELERIRRAAWKAGWGIRWSYDGYVDGERAVRVWMVQIHSSLRPGADGEV